MRKTLCEARRPADLHTVFDSTGLTLFGVHKSVVDWRRDDENAGGMPEVAESFSSVTLEQAVERQEPLQPQRAKKG
jgi:hypothetical protein